MGLPNLSEGESRRLKALMLAYNIINSKCLFGESIAEYMDHPLITMYPDIEAWVKNFISDKEF